MWDTSIQSNQRAEGGEWLTNGARSYCRACCWLYVTHRCNRGTDVHCATTHYGAAPSCTRQSTYIQAPLGKADGTTGLNIHNVSSVQSSKVCTNLHLRHKCYIGNVG